MANVTIIASWHRESIGRSCAVVNDTEEVMP